MRADVQDTFDVAPGRAKLRATRVAAAIIGAVMHVVQAVVFGVLGYPLLAALSVGSVAWYGVAVAAVRTGRGGLGWWMVYAEIFLHAGLLTLLLGPGTGYWLYFFVLAAGVFVVTGAHQAGERALAVALAVLAMVGVLIAAGPWWAVPDSHRTGLRYMNIAGVFAGMTGIVAWFAAASDRAETAARREHARSEALLLNVLPAPIASRLKASPGVIADEVDEVTVLFADIVGFTPLAAQLSAVEVVELLADLFRRFDRVVERQGLEKIKTIGDAYMAVAGVPLPVDDPARRAARAAVAFREAVGTWSQEHDLSVDVRIGLHTGPVVAGVIGEQKFTYDLWGDTVNLASRMESQGVPGRIQVTAAVRERLGHAWRCIPRGSVSVKGRGEVQTWFLEPADSAPEEPLG